MTREQLVAMEQRISQNIAAVRDQLLRLEGYRGAINDVIKADDAAAKAAQEAANQPTETKPENPDAAQAAA